MGYQSSLIGPKTNRNLVSATVTATGVSARFSLGIADSYMLVLQIGTVTGTSPTLDVVLQTSYDKGVNYNNLPIRWTQKTSSTTEEVIVFRNGLGNNEVALAQVVAGTGGQLAKNCCFDPAYLQLSYTAGGTTPSFPVSLHAVSIIAGTGAR